MALLYGDNFLLFIFILIIIIQPLSGDVQIKSYVSQKTIDTLMLESLKNNQVLACENEKITLSCPKNTHIVITHSFFGRLIPSTELCPAPKNYILGKEDTACDVPEADMRLKELCEGKRKCRITVKPSFVDRDPCPETSKYLQMSYKCKPISFEDQHFCEGTQLQLTCKSSKRLSIYSASWGRNMNGVGSTKCTSNFKNMNDNGVTGVDNDCLVDVLPQVLQECHAKSNCAMAVNDYFFGSPCKHGVQKSLSIVYMCVNDEVFSDAAIKGQLETMNVMRKEFKEKQDAESIASQEDDDDDYVDEDYDKINTNVKLPKQEINIVNSNANNEIIFQRDEPILNEKEYHHVDTEDYKTDDKHVIYKESNIVLTTESPDAIIIVKEFYAFVDFIKNNQERCLLYFGISVAVAIILILLAFICYYTKKSHSLEKEKMLVSNSSKPHHGEMSLLIGSNGSTPLYFNPSEPDMYGGSGTSFQYTDVERIYSSPSYTASTGQKEPDDSRISIPTFMRYDSSMTPPALKLTGRYNYC
uniref:SUEL-type lectin domain-containing protein n=1 Tax=Parastrongyloides trichosuri TaxID=131310 RepID=A0A0N5A1W8_PARTI